MGLKRWFLAPPRPHGDVEYSRHVSFLELFYDLVYVVVIGQAAHHLAEHVTWVGVRDFAIVFGLIWLAWFNGTLWHELHGREDGRSRNNIFAQMGLIALLAVFAGEAAGADGTAFAVVYVLLFVWFTWQWYVVHRIDKDRRYRPTTIKYLTGMVATVAAIAISAGLDGSARLGVWAMVVVGWVVGGLVLMATDHTEGFGEGVTGSLVERFGLVTIIVLGEVVIGVVDGMSDAEGRDGTTIAVGMAGLVIGMGIWWNYFDLLGRRVPQRRGGWLAVWMYVHLPLTMAIAAAGAAMVSLVEHADDTRTPPATAWLLATSVAVVLASVALATRALPEEEFPGGMTAQILPTMGVTIVVVLTAAAIRPSPLVLSAAIVVALLAAWLWLFVAYLAGGGRSASSPIEVG